MSATRELECHSYYEVKIGKICHKCKKRVRVVMSGIACPCGHTWYCA